MPQGSNPQTVKVRAAASGLHLCAVHSPVCSVPWGRCPPFIRGWLYATAGLGCCPTPPKLAPPLAQLDVTDATTPVAVGDAACLICEQRPLNSMADVSAAGRVLLGARRAAMARLAC